MVSPPKRPRLGPTVLMTSAVVCAVVALMGIIWQQTTGGVGGL